MISSGLLEMIQQSASCLHLGCVLGASGLRLCCVAGLRLCCVEVRLTGAPRVSGLRLLYSKDASFAISKEASSDK